MAKSNFRTIKSKFCQEIADHTQKWVGTECEELTDEILRSVLADEERREPPCDLVVCNADQEQVMSLTEFAERLTLLVGNSIAAHIFHLGDAIAESVEC